MRPRALVPRVSLNTQIPAFLGSGGCGACAPRGRRFEKVSPALARISFAKQRSLVVLIDGEPSLPRSGNRGLVYPPCGEGTARRFVMGTINYRPHPWFCFRTVLLVILKMASAAGIIVRGGWMGILRASDCRFFSNEGWPAIAPDELGVGCCRGKMPLPGVRAWARLVES